MKWLVLFSSVLCVLSVYHLCVVGRALLLSSGVPHLRPTTIIRLIVDELIVMRTSD